MVKDKYKALWISHSSISDYLKCPRSYFLKNIYKDPSSNHKITLMQPSLALGQVVHDVIESLSLLPVEQRLSESLSSKLLISWQKITGPLGGFKTQAEENNTKERSLAMLKKITDNPGPILKKAIKIRAELPYFWIAEDDNIILCGKIDWLEYIDESDSVRIIDFKTGKYNENPSSLQLPIYHLLVKNCQSKKISGAAYWYLGRDDKPLDVNLPTVEDALGEVSEIAQKIRQARKLDQFVCSKKDGCIYCTPFEFIVSGKAKCVGTDNMKRDIYII